MNDIVLITTTVEKRDDAEKISKKLLEMRLMACAQITGPIKSVYRWENSIVEGEEFLLTVKTTPALQQKACTLISQLHPYDLPEILAQKPAFVHPEYAKWVYGECNEQ